MAPLIQNIGPKDWNLLELRLAKAIDVGKVKEPDLDETSRPLLKIFEHERWQVKPEEIEVLKPSIQLASNLVRVAMPYIATFLPPRDDLFVPGDLHDKNGLRQNLCPTEINLKDNPSDTEVAAALESLENLAPFINWQINNEMYAVSGNSTRENNKALGWIGITRLADEPRPWGPLTDTMVIEADTTSRGLGLDQRPLIIAIMGEYVQTIKKSPKYSEQRLRATFMAGVTMAHEIGHAIFHQDFRSIHLPSMEEPYVGDDCCAELGTALVKWIFGGFHPNVGSLRGHSLVDHTSHLSWTEYYTTDISRRPLYKTFYSISIPWIEEKLTQGWWDSLPSGTNLIDFSAKAKVALKAVVGSDANGIATARLPDWYYSWSSGTACWKDNHGFRLRNFGTGNEIEGLTEEEIELAKAKQPRTLSDNLIAYMDPEQQANEHTTFAKLIADDEDVEEEWYNGGGAELPSLEAGIVSHDGNVQHAVNIQVVEKDISTFSGEERALTDIVVRYLPEHYDSTKRARGGYSQHGQPVKKIKALSAEVDKLLEKSSSLALAATMTRIEIQNMCIARRISGYPEVQPNELWQHSHPDLDHNVDDARVTACLSNDMMEAALEYLFYNDLDAQLKVKDAILSTVYDWGLPQLQQFCDANIIDYRKSENASDVREVVTKFKKDEIEGLRMECSRMGRLPSDRAIAADDPFNWTIKDLQRFFNDNNLPTGGTLASQRIRVKRWKDEQNRGSLIRRTQFHRLDNNGFEVYTFRALLGASTVGALKSALYIAGNFPSEAVLTLYFRDKYYESLHDGKPLEIYNKALPDWTSLNLKVGSYWDTAPGNTLATDIDADAKAEVRFHDPISFPGVETPNTFAPQFPIITHGNEPSPAELLTAAAADPKIQREAAVAQGSNPTFSELLSSVGNRAPKLDRIALAGGKFQKQREGLDGWILSESGLEIYDEVQDYEDEEEERRRVLETMKDVAVKGQMKTPDNGTVNEAGTRTKRKREPFNGYPSIGASHMVDLLYATSKKFIPLREDDDEEDFHFY